MQTMLQRLLADRFTLLLHRQSKGWGLYVLSPGKNGTRLQESKGEGEGSIDAQPNRMTVVVQRTPMSQMIDMLTQVLGAPVLDQTGLKGKYDITVNLADYMAEMQTAGGAAPTDPIAIVKSRVRATTRSEAREPQGAPRCPGGRFRREGSHGELGSLRLSVAPVVAQTLLSEPQR